LDSWSRCKRWSPGISRLPKNKDLLFSETDLALLRSKNGALFQLRHCPALAQKPKGDDAISKKPAPRPKFDPFAEPPPELLVASIPRGQASHTLVLNKYPVIHNHFIIATKSNKPQTDLLEKDDLGMTHACLQAWQGQPQGPAPARLFAFFNSGEHSGASQVHRHLQFLPIEDMAGPEPHEWEILLDRMTTRAHPTLPLFRDPTLAFLHFSTPLEDAPSTTSLYSKYIMLMKAALSAARFPNQPLNENVEIERDGQTTFSYNLAMTKERMAICPRRSESANVPGAGQDGSVALNGTLLAGTLMVKHEVEWDLLRGDHSLLDDILTSIGYSPVSWERPGGEINL